MRTNLVPTTKYQHMKANAAAKPKNQLAFKRKKKKGFQMASEGMKVEGPSHEDGGVPAVSKDGEQVAEVEGGERIFSVEDTQYLEREARRIVSLMQKDSQSANEAARQLGFKVVEMIIQQEKNQREQEGGGEEADAAAINSFGTGDAGGQNFE